MGEALWMILTVNLLQLVHMQSEETKAVIFSLQERYCGEQFCNTDPNYSPPVCPLHFPVSDPLPVTSTNTTHLPDSFSNTSRENVSRCNPCAPCSCDDSCQLLGTCCADKHIGAKYYLTCKNVFVYNHHAELFRFEIVTKCLRDAPNYSDDLAEKCEDGRLGYVADGRIVTALYPGNRSVTFKNKYCALCYVSDFTPWKVYITCKAGFDPGNVSDINAMIRSVERTRECDVSEKLESDDLQLPVACDSNSGMISTCNETGQWREFNSSLDEACNSYYNPTFDMGYRNIFCFLCNGEDEGELECPPVCVRRLYKDVQIRPFAALLNFDRSDAEVLRDERTRREEYQFMRIGQQRAQQCREGDVYDSVVKRCRETYCPLSVLNNSSGCVNLVPNQQHVFTLVNATVYFTEWYPTDFGGLDSRTHTEVHESIETLFEEKGLFVGQCEYTTMAIIANNSLFTIGAQLSLKLFLPKNLDLRGSRSKLKDRMKLSQMTNKVNMFSKIEIGHHSLDSYLFMSRGAFGGLNEGIMKLDRSKVIDVPLVFNVSCPMVKVKVNEVKEVNDLFALQGRVLKREDFFWKSDDILFVCNHILSKEMPSKQPVQAADQTGLLIGQILTGVCLSCSLLCLLLTLLVYILLRELHTVPGLNLILLTSSLFVAQALYLFGAGAVTTPTICTVLAVLIHYFWLVSFAWMNVCCIHMFRVFNSSFSSLDFIRNKHFVVMKYSGFAYGIPLLIVATTLVTTHLLSNKTSVGYGGPSLCFISTGLVSVIAFGVPTALTVVINAALIISTMLSLRKKRANGIRMVKNSEVNDISKFCKLSSITALTWVFGFLGYFIASEWLTYIFTVLTAGQGVFIFLSFVVSRRILKMVRNRLGCPQSYKAHSGTFGDSNKDPHTSSCSETQELSIRL